MNQIRTSITTVAVALAISGCGSDPALPAFGFALDGEPVTPAKLEMVAESTHIQPELIVFFMAWPDSVEKMRSPRESLEAIEASGAVPVLTWEPFIDRGTYMETVLAEDVFAGKYDAVIDAFAGKVGEFGGEVWIRFAHEMNFDYYHWGVDASEFDARAPLVYRDFYRYVVDRFRSAGTHNVRWVFCPNAESIPNPKTDPAAGWNRASRYYPGDDYVDILGMDGYNWGDTQTPGNAGWQSRWQTFAEIFQPLHEELRALAPRKPIYVFETASAPSGGDKAKWIDDALATAAAWNLAGICWFEVDKEVDWRIATGMTPEFLTTFADRVNTRSPGDL